MTKQKETSDELTPEDKEAFRFYLSTILQTRRVDGVAMSDVLDCVEDFVKEEKRRLGIV